MALELGVGAVFCEVACWFWLFLLLAFGRPVFPLNPEEFYRVFTVGFVVKLLSFHRVNWLSVDLGGRNFHGV